MPVLSSLSGRDSGFHRAAVGPRRCPPKAEATGSNPVGHTNFIQENQYIERHRRRRWMMLKPTRPHRVHTAGRVVEHANEDLGLRWEWTKGNGDLPWRNHQERTCLDNPSLGVMAAVPDVAPLATSFFPREATQLDPSTASARARNLSTNAATSLPLAITTFAGGIGARSRICSDDNTDVDSCINRGGNSALSAGHAHMAPYSRDTIGPVNDEIMPLWFAGDRIADSRVEEIVPLRSAQRGAQISCVVVP